MANGTLYIIGNGFDLHHGLPTTTEDFRCCLASQSIAGISSNALDLFESYGVNWSAFEEGMAEIDLLQIEEDHLGWPDYMSDHEYDRDNTILEMDNFLYGLRRSIDDALKEMVKRAEEVVQEMADRMVFDGISSKTGNIIYRTCRGYRTLTLPWFLSPEDRVVSFNYTSTLESLYGVPEGCEILHIHGMLADCDDLVFGYGEKGEVDRVIRRNLENLPVGVPDEVAQHCYENRDCYIDKQRECILNFYESLQKDYQVDKLKTFLKTCSTVLNVAVLGHSMGEIDRVYMEEIERELRPVNWFIWQYDHNPSRKFISTYTFAAKVHFFDSKLFDRDFP